MATTPTEVKHMFDDEQWEREARRVLEEFVKEEKDLEISELGSDSESNLEFDSELLNPSVYCRGLD